MPAVIRRYRDAAGLSQQELADRVGISKSYISSLELGYRAPSLNLLVKIAQTLEVKAGKMSMKWWKMPKGFFDVSPVVS